MTTALKESKSTQKKKGRPKIPDYLVYEILGNRKIYYRDYQKVLSGELPPEAVMGSSDLQAWIVALIVRFLAKTLNFKKYLLLTNEVGYFYTPQRKGKWLNLDIAIVSREKFKKPSGTYLTIPPEVVIEVDTKADLRKFTTPQDYFHRKTQDLLDHGVERVIWIFTKDKKVWIAERGSPWLIVDWNYEIPIVEGLSFNLQKLTEEEEK